MGSIGSIKGLTGSTSGVVTFKVDAPEDVDDCPGLDGWYALHARDVLEQIHHHICELPLCQALAMLLNDELGQFNRLTLGEMFHGIVMCCIEVCRPSTKQGQQTTGSTGSTSFD